MLLTETCRSILCQTSLFFFVIDLGVVVFLLQVIGISINYLPWPLTPSLTTLVEISTTKLRESYSSHWLTGSTCPCSCQRWCAQLPEDLSTMHAGHLLSLAFLSARLQVIAHPVCWTTQLPVKILLQSLGYIGMVFLLTMLWLPSRSAQLER